QTKGLPMGSPISPGLAVIDASRKEQEGREKLKQAIGRFYAIRFRDDIRIIMRGEKQQNEIETVRRETETMYGKTLKVELEGSKKNEMEFIGFRIWKEGTKVRILEKNENWDAMNKTIEIPQKKVRWPSIQGNWPKRIYEASVLGALERAKK